MVGVSRAEDLLSLYIFFSLCSSRADTLRNSSCEFSTTEVYMLA